jgi:glycerol-3-phosphate dehydrogenase
MFVLPAGQFTLFGTTDTRTTMAPGQVQATEADVAYLLASVNALCPEALLVRDDVVSAWAGLRPLVADGQASDASEGRLSREHALAWSRSGMLTVTGGKLTTFRSMAAEAVDAVIDKLHRRAGQPLTQRRTYPGGEFLSLAAEEAAATSAIGDPEAAVRLVRAHGARWRRVWALTDHDRRLRERLDPELPYLAVEVAYAVRQELACTPGDVLLRRMPLAFETRDHGRATAEQVADLMAPLLHWDAATRAAMLADYEAEICRTLGIAAE